MNEVFVIKERYRFLISGDPREDGFLEEAEKEAKNCGVEMAFVTQIDLRMEGGNDALTKFFIWLLSGPFLKKVQHLKPEP